MSLRTLLLLLLLGGVGPLVVCSAAGVLLLTRTYQQETISAGLETARALSTAVDNELARAAAITQTLARAQALRTNDLAGFHAYALRVVEGSHGSVRAINLLSPDGAYLLTTLSPFGAPLPAALRQAVDQSEPGPANAAQVGNVRIGRVTGVPVLPVRAEVIVGGTVRYVVSASFQADLLQDVLARQQASPQSTLAVLDRNRTIVARSREAERFVAKQATGTLQQLMNSGPSGFGKSITQEGGRAVTFYSTSPSSGWTAVIGQPQDGLLTGRGPAFSLLLAGVLVSSALGLFGALLLARALVRPIDQLRRAAKQLGRGQPIGSFRTAVSELAPVYEALQSTAHALREKEALKEQLLAHEQERWRTSQRESRSKDEYLATLSHELRNPMAAIGNALQVMSKAPHDALNGRMLEIANRQFGHLRYLVDDLLELSRIMTGKVALHPTLFDLGECVEMACQSLQAGDQFAHREIVLDRQPALVRADVHRLQQVASNLVANACKYSPADQPVAVRVRAEASRAVLEVVDQGIGMDAQTLDHAFDLFYQAAQGGPEGGLGVGLALCRKLVEMQDGTIQAWSDGPGSGSRLVVTLPLAGSEPDLRT